jgi:hypothetical protein
MDEDPFKDWDHDGFPRIGMTVDGKQVFKPLRQAVPLYDSGWVRVELTGGVLMADLSVRPLTPQEALSLSYLADEYSGSK